MNLQSKSSGLKSSLNHKEEVANKIYDDYQKLVDFNKEVWYDKDIDELYDDLVLGHLKEEEYMPKIKPLITFKDSELFNNFKKNKRGNSLPKNAKRGQNLDLKSGRNSVAYMDMPVLMNNRNFDELKLENMKHKKTMRNFSNNKQLLTSDLAPIDDSLTEDSIPTLENDLKTEIDEDGDSPKKDQKDEKSRSSSVRKFETKKVGKASFGVNPSNYKSQETLLPPLGRETEVHETSGQSIRKMPKIVRKILEKKMNINSDFLRSIDALEKGKKGNNIW